jgi:hypothetical protein
MCTRRIRLNGSCGCTSPAATNSQKMKTGRGEVLVHAYPEGARRQVSVKGSVAPAWNPIGGVIDDNYIDLQSMR